MKEKIKRIPFLSNLARQAYWKIKGSRQFPGSLNYWEGRYAAGGNSGVGSYDKLSEFKAEVINAIVAENGVTSVIEFGCGDGNQLKLAVYPEYIGIDVSQTAISICKKKFSHDSQKRFKLASEYGGEKADLSLSLDVIYHLVEDQVFDAYMKTLFKAANRYVCIYSSNTDENPGHEGTHVRQRKFTKWIDENLSGWEMIDYIPNRYPYDEKNKTGSISDFYIYKKV